MVRKSQFTVETEGSSAERVLQEGYSELNNQAPVTSPITLKGTTETEAEFKKTESKDDNREAQAAAIAADDIDSEEDDENDDIRDAADDDNASEDEGSYANKTLGSRFKRPN